MIARDVGGGTVTTDRKPLDQMQRIASAEAGGSLAAPDELDDEIPFVMSHAQSRACQPIKQPTQRCDQCAR